MTDTLTTRLLEQARRIGFDAAGVAGVRASDHGAFYQNWLARGHHGDMAYLARPDAVHRRTHPDEAWPEVRSALVVAHGYAPPGDAGSAGPAAHGSPTGRATSGDPARGVIARYTRGRDYHKVVKAKLLELLRWLEGEVGRELPTARAYVDTGPVLERELARRAGLGWFGKSTMLIHPRRGSYFFLGSLLTELELEPTDPFEKDHCGTCNACVDACPTGALLGRDAAGAPMMDATRCISYLTIEQRGPIPAELRPLMGNRVYGCDICQEVCPFTGSFSKPSPEPAYAARAPGEPPFGVQLEPGSSSSHPGTGSPSLIELLETALDEAAWDSFSRGSAIRRAGRAGFARNVCVGLGNWGSPEAVPVLASALSDREPLVRAHAAWALGRVSSSEAREALWSRSSVESDESVRSELAAALGP